PSSFPDGAAVTGLVYERYGQAPCPSGGNNNGTRSPMIWLVGGTWDANGMICFGGGALPWGNGTSNNWLWTGYPYVGPGNRGLAPMYQSNPPYSLADCTLVQGMHLGVNVLLGDGSVKLVSPSVSQTTWSAVATPNNSDYVGNDW